MRLRGRGEGRREDQSRERKEKERRKRDRKIKKKHIKQKNHCENHEKTLISVYSPTHPLITSSPEFFFPLACAALSWVTSSEESRPAMIEGEKEGGWVSEGEWVRVGE